MEITESALRERYQSQSTDELLALHGRGMLTDLATRVLEEVLDQRGVIPEARKEVATTVQSARTAEKLEARLIASLGARLLGAIIDLGVASTLVLVCWIFGAVAGLSSVALVGIYLLPILYLVLGDALPRGQTVGKRLIGTATVDANTLRPCTGGQALLRNLPRWLIGLIDVPIILSANPKRQRIGDMLAKTVVVNVDVLTEARAERKAITNSSS